MFCNNIGYNVALTDAAESERRKNVQRISILSAKQLLITPINHRGNETGRSGLREPTRTKTTHDDEKQWDKSEQFTKHGQARHRSFCEHRIPVACFHWNSCYTFDQEKKNEVKL